MAKRNFFSSSGNPFLKEKAFQNQSNEILDASVDQAQHMSIQGAINKSFLLFALLMITTLVSYAIPSQLFMWTGIIGGLIAVLVTSFRPRLAPVLAPVYALLEGLFVGTVTRIYGEAFGGGIIFHAVTLTFALLFSMLFIYKAGIIKVTGKFRMGVAMATMGIFLVYLANIILGLFGIDMPFLHEGGMMGIGISVVIIGIASLNLLLDFDNFEKGEQFGAPSYMEWFCAMGLLVTLVWLYIELLRLISLLSGRD
jgi:uncharacterized YccA/Bax inhibitor family protein